MNPEKGYYSLVQFCPDPARAEAVNVGVLLVCPELRFIDVKMSSASTRAAKFFGRCTFDADFIRLAKQSLTNRIRIEHDDLLALDNLLALIDSRGNDIQLTKPRPIKVRSPGMDLERLFCELVEPICDADESRALIIPKMDEAFHSPRLRGRIAFNEPVVIPILENERRFPYAYENGAENLILPKRFSLQAKQAKRVASQLGVEGQFLQRHPDNNRQRRLIIVSAQSSENVNGAIEWEVKRVFDELDVEFIPSKQVDQFIERVAAEAHQPMPRSRDHERAT